MSLHYRIAGQDLTYGSYSGRKAGQPDLPVQYITGGSQAVAGYSGMEGAPGDPLYTTAVERMTTPSHTTQQIQLPGFGPTGSAQQLTYNLPFYDAPALDSDAPSVTQRSRAIWQAPQREKFKFREYDSVTDPETGEVSYVKRSDWRAVTPDAMDTWIRQYNKSGQDRTTGPGSRQALVEQTEAQRAYAKWWNETRYAQMQNIMGQHMKNQGILMQGMGEAQRKDILRQGESMRESAYARAAGTGMASTTAMSAGLRGAQLETQQQLGRMYGQLGEARLGLHDSMAKQYMRIIEGRTDEYPSTESMAKIMFEYGKSGQEQKAPKRGCCFIFMEARYGDGTLDECIRRMREEWKGEVDPELSRRVINGYYKVSEVLVPLMRKSKLVKLAVRIFLTDPAVAYCNWHYRKDRKKKTLGRYIGWLFKPMQKFWEKVLSHVGQDHEFIRENGEVR